jgi:hypothetical protein
MRIRVESNFPDVAQRVQQFGRQGRFAAAVALTRTVVVNVKPGMRKEMSRAFDRPTNYTLNSTVTKRATKDNLEARLWLKDDIYGKGTPADRYLSPQIFGGERRQKGLEIALQAARMMPPGYVAVPAVGALLDANGNVKRGQIVQILSQLRLQRGAGYESRATGSTRSKRTIAKQGVTYFAVPVTSRGLKPGVYLRRKFGAGSAVKPVFVYARRATYRPLLKFFEVGEKEAVSNFPGHFDIEITKAAAGAGLR